LFKRFKCGFPGGGILFYQEKSHFGAQDHDAFSMPDLDSFSSVLSLLSCASWNDPVSGAGLLEGGVLHYSYISYHIGCGCSTPRIDDLVLCPEGQFLKA
jgi:hypothetical protein